MEIVPAIANYFGVTIDELFGYHNDRERRIDAIIQRVDAYGIRVRGDDEWVDDCLAILREGLAEFPRNERLMITLAETLWEAGWRRQDEWLSYDEEGFIHYSYDKEKKNKYWVECGKLCCQLADNTKDNDIFTRSVAILVPLYRTFGEYGKAVDYARRMPELCQCREYLLTEGTDGKLGAAYIGAFLLKAAREFAEQVVFALVTNKNYYESDMPIEKVKGAIGLFDLICDDGNMGEYHGFVSKLYLYLSRLEWERGYHDDAFVSLDEALKHAKAADTLCDGKEHSFTAPLVSFVTYKAENTASLTRSLPEDWPFWCNPSHRQVEAEIKADPRWSAWVEKTKQ